MIYLLRHGLIEGSEEKRFIGQSDVPLSDEGRRQAEVWRKRLSGIPFEEYFCSDLVRSQESAQIIAGKKRNFISVRRELREIRLGSWERLLMSDVRNRFPEQWSERGNDFRNFRPPGGESFSDLRRRVSPCLKEIIENAKGDILVVGHAGVNRIILGLMLGIAVNKMFSLAQDYGALNIIDHKCESAPVKALNLTPNFALDERLS